MDQLVYVYDYYLQQRKEVMFLGLYVCLSDCLSAKLLKNLSTYFAEIVYAVGCGGVINPGSFKGYVQQIALNQFYSTDGSASLGRGLDFHSTSGYI